MVAEIETAAELTGTIEGLNLIDGIFMTFAATKKAKTPEKKKRQKYSMMKLYRFIFKEVHVQECTH